MYQWYTLALRIYLVHKGESVKNFEKGKEKQSLEEKHQE